MDSLPIIVLIALISITIIGFSSGNNLIIDLLVIGFLVVFYYVIIRHELRNDITNLINKLDDIEKRFEGVENTLIKLESAFHKDVNKLSKLKRKI